MRQTPAFPHADSAAGVATASFERVWPAGYSGPPCRRGGGAADQFVYEARHAGRKGFMSLLTWVHACGCAGLRRIGDRANAASAMLAAQAPCRAFLGLLKDSLWIRSYAHLRGSETPFL
ncbi:MAG: hypothetical protein EON54_09660 [Alcaligenaceae bacterium]|nr:MAG: hypothetical protein EON54_09660 [Alcaligenaceae bacterium]